MQTCQEPQEELISMKMDEEIDLRVERIECGLEKIQKAFQVIRRVGINKEILIAYLHDKSKIGKRDIEAILYHQQEFFKKISQSSEPEAKPQTKK